MKLGDNSRGRSFNPYEPNGVGRGRRTWESDVLATFSKEEPGELDVLATFSKEELAPQSCKVLLSAFLQGSCKKPEAHNSVKGDAMRKNRCQ